MKRSCFHTWLAGSSSLRVVPRPLASQMLVWVRLNLYTASQPSIIHRRPVSFSFVFYHNRVINSRSNWKSTIRSNFFYLFPFKLLLKHAGVVCLCIVNDKSSFRRSWLLSAAFAIQRPLATWIGRTLMLEILLVERVILICIDNSWHRILTLWTSISRWKRPGTRFCNSNFLCPDLVTWVTSCIWISCRHDIMLYILFKNTHNWLWQGNTRKFRCVKEI